MATRSATAGDAATGKERERRARGPRPAGPPPDAARLREAALHHLGRYAATEVGLVRVLRRRIDRWARAATEEGADAGVVAAAAAAARSAAADVARRLTEAGAISDESFAAARARRLGRAGRSRRAIAAHLGAKGVDAATAAAALPDDPDRELDAALAYLRRRRAGPFGDPDAPRLPVLAALGRAGFERGVAERALDTDRGAAEARLLARR